MSARIPSYRLHKPTGQAVVTLSGKDHYLGRHGSPESRREYERLIAEWLVNRHRPPEPTSRFPDLTMNELLVAYWDHVQSYYVKDGKPTSEPGTIRQALRPVRELYGDTPAQDFGPLALKAVRQAMIEPGWCRSFINKQVNRVQQMFAWAAGEELVPLAVYQALTTVAGLRQGRIRGPREAAGRAGDRRDRREDAAPSLAHGGDDGPPPAADRDAAGGGRADAGRRHRPVRPGLDLPAAAAQE